ncbi:MAG TPA: 50S ribosomal protein L13 [Nitrospinota bacterium]|jgi:large subunit ribosomal protein L13|nr:50S ribosomal protein L13 [Nitrospinota bacterium]|tara:strand:- start:25168 stop:25620 length:453 start_codon:yes stop_codon:yes gene_type:complete
MKQSKRSFSAKAEDFPLNDRNWYVIDAKGQTLGKIAVLAANVLRGKDKATYTPHVDTGSFVVVINAEKAKLSGNKLDQKIYYRHTGYIGGLKSATAREMLAKKPDEVIVKAVKGMLPKNRLSNAMIKKLKVYAGPQHPHAAQRPFQMEVH